MVAGVKLSRPAARELGRRVGVVGEQDLAQRAGVGGQQRADVERLQAVVGAEDVVDDEHLALVQRADAHALVLRAASESDQFSARVRSSLPSR